MRRSLLLAFAASALLGACSKPSSPVERSPARREPERALAAAPASPAVPAAATSQARASIYELPVRLLDDRGNSAELSVFRGHPVLITMFYGSCKAACPLITADLQRIEKQLAPAVKANLRVLMVSFDARRDTPADLSRMKRERGMDAERWTLASAPEDGARELGAVLGIRFRKLDDGQFFHSSSIILLDEQGREKARLDGLGHDAAPLLAALAAPST